MSHPACRLSMEVARMDYRDYIDRVGNQELVRLLVEMERQMNSEEKGSPTASDDTSSQPFFSSRTTPMGQLAHAADGADSTENESSNVVSTSPPNPEQPSVSPAPPEAEVKTAHGSDVSISSPLSYRAVSVESRRTKNPSASSRSSHTHKLLSTHRLPEEASSPPQPPLLTVESIEAVPDSRSSEATTPSPPRSHQALESLKGILQKSRIPRFLSRPELQLPETERHPRIRGGRRSSRRHHGWMIPTAEACD